MRMRLEYILSTVKEKSIYILNPGGKKFGLVQGVAWRWEIVLKSDHCA
jgi:hypothetical protein